MFEGTQLGEVVNLYVVPYQETNINCTDVVAFNQMRSVINTGIQYVDCYGEILKHGQFFNFLNGQDAGGIHDLDDIGRGLDEPALILISRDHEIITRGANSVDTGRVVDVVEQPKYV